MLYERMDSIKHVILCRLSTLPLLCLCLSLVTLPRTSCAPTTPKPAQNITVTVPEGTQDHGNPSLLCTPTRWTDVAVFFLANYVAHALTTRSLPGEPALGILRAQVAALMFPHAGIMRGIKAIRQRAILSATPLETAAKAGALCVVIRTPEWLPQRGDVACVKEINFPVQTRPSTKSRIDGREAFKTPYFHIEPNMIYFLPSNSIAEKGRKVHGICYLPNGYALAILPSGAQITEICKDKREEPEVNVQRSLENDPSHPDTRPRIELSSNYNLPKCVIAIFQTLYASATLYQTRGDQIQRYGYAAFGLTVAPYLLMSIVNLLGTVLTPDYPCLYLVRSEVMDEAARREGAKFEGMVATLKSDPRRVWHYVEFTIDEYEMIFIRSPRDSISQHGLHDATNVVQTQIDSLYGILPQNPRRLGAQERLQNLLQPQESSQDLKPSLIIDSGSLGHSDNLPPPSILNKVIVYVGLIIGVVPIAIVGGLSHFHADHSTIAQRVWTMTWFAVGWYVGLHINTVKIIGKRNFSTIVIFGAPAIGGFVVVGQMLRSYGQCIEIGGTNF